jgi:hypothetical protein
MSNDYPGQGGFTIVFGKGFDEADLEGLPGDILVVGACAINERGADLRRRYPDRRVIEVDAHNDLRGITAGLATMMKVRPMAMVPLNPLHSLWILLQARLHGLNSRIPPLFGGPAPTGLREAEQRWYGEGRGARGGHPEGP